MRRARPALSLLLVLVVAFHAGCAGLSVFETAESLIAEGKQLYADKKYDEAVSKFWKALEKDPRAWEAYYYLARSFIARLRSEERRVGKECRL